MFMKGYIISDIMSCRPLKVNGHFGRRASSVFDAGFLLALSSALNMKVICSSEISVDSQRDYRALSRKKEPSLCISQTRTKKKT
jgi:hypothetical protein